MSEDRGRSFAYLFGAPVLLFGANCLVLAAGARGAAPADFGSLAATLAMLVLLSLPGAAVAWALAGEIRTEGDDRPSGASAGILGVRSLLPASVGLAMLATALAALLAAATHMDIVSALLLGPYTLVTILAAVPIALLRRHGRGGAVRIVAIGSLIVLVGTGIPFLRSDPSVTMLLFGNLLGAFVALGLGIAFAVPRFSAGWWSGPQLDLASSLRLLGRTLAPPGAFWLLALIDIFLANRYLPGPLAGAYAGAALTGRLLLCLPFAVGYLQRRKSERMGKISHPASSTIVWAGVGAALLTVAALFMTLLWKQTVTFLFGGTMGSVVPLVPPLAVSGAFVAASLSVFRFHLSVDSRAHYLSLFLVGLEALLVVWFHTSSQIATIVLAVTALSLFLQIEAAYAILRWEPLLGRLSEPDEIQRLEKGPDGPIELSLILPCYNAGSTLGEFIERLDVELAAGGPYELIVVSDGSTDETVAVATASTSRAVRVLHYQVRSGKGHALRVGLAKARGSYVAFIDADGDIDPAAIGPFVSLMKLYTPDIILGSKRHPLSNVTYPASRRVMSWIYHKLARVLFRINVRDTQTGLKLIRRDVLSSVLPLMLEKRYAFDLEFLVVARSQGFVRVFEAPVRIDYRFRSQVNPQAVVRIILDTLAVFYRRYILNTYRRLEDHRPHASAAAPEARMDDGPQTSPGPGSQSLATTEGDHSPPLAAQFVGRWRTQVASTLDRVKEPWSRFATSLRPRPGWVEFLTGRGPVIGAVVAAGIALFITRRVWGSGPPAGDDVMGHLVRAQFGVDQLLARGQLDGWFPRFMVGHQTYLFYGPGFVWSVGLIRGLSLGLVSTPGAFKLAVIGSYVVLPAAVAFSASALGLDRVSSAAAAVLSLGVSTRFGFGPRGLFGTGLVVQQLAGVFFFVALGGLARTLKEHGNRWPILTAAAVAMLVITHLISLAIFVVIAALFVLLSVVASSPRLIRGFPKAIAALGGGCMLAGFWVVPFLAHRNLRGPSAGLAPLPLRIRLTQIIDGAFVYRSVVGLLVALSIGSVLVAAVRGWRPGFVLALLPIGYVLAVHVLFARFPSDLTTALVNRGWGYVGILAILPLAGAIGFVTRRFGGIGHTVAVLVLSGLIAMVSLGPALALVTEFGRPSRQLAEAASQLARLVPEGGRFTIERRFEYDRVRTGLIHPDIWLVYASRRNGLVVVNPASSISTAGFEERAIGKKPVDQSADALVRYGVTYLVTTTGSLAAELSQSSRYGVVWQQPPISIFEVRSRPNNPAPSSLLSTDGAPLSAALSSADPDHPRIEFDAREQTAISVAIGWSPKWHARLDGAPVPLAPTRDYLLSIAAPEGRHRLALDFVPDWWDRAGRMLSLFTVMLGSAAGIVRLWGAGRRGSNAGPDGRTA